MKRSLKQCALALAGASLMVLQGCGGGGGSSASSAGAPAPAAVTVSGVAASGAAFVGATITVKDSTGATVGTSGTIGADGQYSITLASGAVAPYVLIAKRTTADGDSESLVSVVPAVTGSAATANITPITHLIASRLASSGDPLKLATELASSTATVNATTVAAKVQEVQNILAPVLTAASTTGTDPLTGNFSVDGTGYDRLLDSIKVTIIPSSATTANIEVAVKQQLAEGDAPAAIQFTNATAAASVPAIPAIDPATLIATGTATKIAAHLAQLNACFNLPTASRVNNPNPSGAGIASANESNIIAPECRTAFIQDGTGVVQFKSNGATIGATSGQPFRALFFDGGTGLTFSQGAYEFTRANGDIVVSYKSTTTAGAETYDAFALRLDPADSKLKQIGNQYNYPGKIAAYHQQRRFITLNQSGWDYLSTGYSAYVNNVTDGAGNPVFDRVVVTSPRGNTVVLKPTAGSAYLGLVQGGTIKNTSIIRIRAEYLEAAKAADDPATKDTVNFFADRTVFTNDVISSIPMQATWKFDYFLAGNTGGTPDATQYYRTRARALTIPELQTKSMAAVSDADIATLQGRAIAAGQPYAGQVSIGGLSSVAVDYTVPAGALPPTSLQLWGRYATGSFNDNASVASTARSGTISCSKQTAGDAHCIGAIQVNDTGSYDSTATLTGAHLHARDRDGREYASFYATYQLP